MLTIAIQAGGESRRMGQDKGLMPFLGQPLIQRVVTRLSEMADETIITTNQPGSYAFLGLPLFADARPGRGALGGLYTAFSNASQALVAVVACDMPFANPSLLAYQVRVLQEESADVVVPLLAEGYEPLHAVYRRETCLPAVEQALDGDRWKLISWFSDVKVRTLTAEECRQHDPQGLAFVNVNTPEELAEAESAARRGA
ncbi:MAG TPA: molybdenum cofactor guanylyltransferase [Anaerolineales bacterium]|jgi:molybdopterin-guanine dinucleotide biosynthesis protein A